MLTYEQIDQLDGKELNEAVAIADGWTRDMETVYEGKDQYGCFCEEIDGWKHTKLGITRRYLQNYRCGKLLDRIALECRCQIVKDFDFENEKLVAYVAIIGDKPFQSQSLTTAINRAYLWHMQGEK